jgi:hypothetical protein
MVCIGLQIEPEPKRLVRVLEMGGDLVVVTGVSITTTTPRNVLLWL